MGNRVDKYMQLNEIFFPGFWLKRSWFYEINMTKEEFTDKFRETLDTLIEQMAQNSEVPVENFYNMTCILENLAFFSPVVYDLIRKPKE